MRARGAQGLWVSRACECQAVLRVRATESRAKIPARYKHCLLSSYEVSFQGADQSFQRALGMAQGFVHDYPTDTDGKGLLFTGTIGVGKTHLAVGILRELIAEKGSNGLFFDYRDLLKQIQGSYNVESSTNEMDILQPVFDVEVLVLDELGAAKPTEWVWDTVALVLNSRYNNRQTTIITTNYPNLSAGAGGRSDIERAAKEQTLGDRIGNRMWSRLTEICVAVEMQGQDFRQTVAKARFGERF